MIDFRIDFIWFNWKMKNWNQVLNLEFASKFYHRCKCGRKHLLPSLGCRHGRQNLSPYQGDRRGRLPHPPPNFNLVMEGNLWRKILPLNWFKLVKRTCLIQSGSIIVIPYKIYLSISLFRLLIRVFSFETILCQYSLHYYSADPFLP